jgi:hypothetical protein
MRIAQPLVFAVVCSSLAIGCFAEEAPPAATPPPAPAPLVVPLVAAPVVSDAGSVATSVDASTEAPVATADAGSSSATASDPIYACTTDADCVLVPVNACCNTGHHAAVNQGKVAAYKALAPKCATKTPCPQYRILDKSTAACSPDTHSCVLKAGLTPGAMMR